MNIFEKSGFVFCGIVHFRGSPRRAYEKVLWVVGCRLQLTVCLALASFFYYLFSYQH
jgi:hypothetical protein